MSIKDLIKNCLSEAGFTPQKWVDQREEQRWRQGSAEAPWASKGLDHQVARMENRRELNVVATYGKNERGHGEFTHRSTRGSR